MSNHVQAPYTIKPSLKAFPLTWLWVACFSYVMHVVEGELVIFIFAILPLILILMLARYGRSYQLKDDQITKTNHITGKTESVNINRVGRIQVKPFAFGYGHIILTLAGGHKLKIKNIKLPSNHAADMFD